MPERPTHSEASDDTDTSTERGSDCEPGDCSSDEQAFSLERTLIVVDWDDTICPTTWLGQQGLLEGEIDSISEEQDLQLSALADQAAETLEAACDQGRVVIITNAVEGWVEHSCLRFLPSLAPTLRSLPKVSARSTYEPLGICCQTEWKCMAFEREVETFAGAFGGAGLSVVSIGDSSHERQALLQATGKVPGSHAKCLKFSERPTIDQLIEQHAVAVGMLEDMAVLSADLSVDIGAMVRHSESL